MKNILILIIVMLACACNSLVEENANRVSGYWIHNYSLLCSDSHIFYHDPTITYNIKVKNKTDSILVFSKYWSSFYFLREKDDSLIQVEYAQQANMNHTEIAPNSEGTIILWQKIPRKNYKCDTSVINDLRSKKYIYHQRKMISKEDSLIYLINRRVDSLKNKQKIIPDNFIIKKSKKYKFYEVGDLPSRIEPPDTVFWTPLE